ncbi:ABC transporter substrate-binding protein [Streptomyces otsuchiensis]|uniref:ABC transporter substrate-binding protein n=1 Tax=Streptomyces otsuchiensis TaxID=2681388 RepID=UPI001031AE69|nr:ABC transporter substrate-binding protein [Streptomyces otsuchiensis]
MTRFGTKSKLVAAAVGGALVLTACGSDNGDGNGSSDDGAQSDGGGGGTITLGYEQEWTTWNATTSDGNLSANSVATYHVTTGFWYFGEGGEITPNEDFGSYEVVNEDPLTVTYTFHEDAAWSDGTPIDCVDALLWWTQQGGYLDWSTPGTGGIEDTKMPDCNAGDKEFTIEYLTPYVDWEAAGPGHGNNSIQPAHVVAEQGGLDSADELIDIIKAVEWDYSTPHNAREHGGIEEAEDALAEAIDFFKTGWIIDGALPDEALIPSSGPFTVGSYDAGEQLTLVPNTEYWGTPAAADEVVFRYIAQDAQAQALQNGEIDIMAPQPSVDLKNQLESLSGVEVEVYDQYLYEHATFNFESGPFSESLPLREAFMKCLPRETLVENLIRPVDPEAEVRNSVVAHPLDPYYDAVVDASLPAEFAEQDIDGAREILEDEDAVGTEIRLRTLDNPRRNAQGQLIKDACDEAGFEVDFEAHGDFFAQDGAMYTNRYDVAMAGWSGSAVIAGWNSTYSTPDECSASGKGNNNGCYSNADLDALLEQVLEAADEDEKVELISEISSILWSDGVSVPLFNHPGMAAWADDVQNVVPNPAQSDIVWNMPLWAR